MPWRGSLVMFLKACSPSHVPPKARLHSAAWRQLEGKPHSLPEKDAEPIAQGHF